MAGPDWIAVDWGTSHLRAWMMRADGTVIARRDSDKGMGVLSRDGFEPALLDLIGEEIGTQSLPVIVCGMAGSRQGWAEAPYAAVPCKAPSGDIATRVPTRDARLSVHILPGVKQEKPADVMRGEETQIAGYLALNPRFDGVICLPGTHSKWAHISAEEIVSFRTFMTGELFALLSRQSVLRHSVGASGWDEEAFSEAVNDAMARPANVSADLFSLRAEALLTGLKPETARARLSGLLIGLELAAARPYWLGQQVVLIGDDALCRAYAGALSAQGLAVERTDAERMTLEGLKAAHHAIRETQE